MSLRKRLRTFFVCLVLEFGVLSGVPIQARELEEVLKSLNQPKLAHVLPSEEEGGGDPPPSSLFAPPPPTCVTSGNGKTLSRHSQVGTARRRGPLA